MVVDQQLKPFALDHWQHFRHHFINQILDREERRGAFPDVILQHVRKLDFVYQTNQGVCLAAQLSAFRRAQISNLRGE